MVTLQDIAVRAGCSVSVVSRALNPDLVQNQTVSVEKANRIIKIAKELGYQSRNSKARGRAVGAVGVFLPENRTSLLLDLLEQVTREANAANTPLYVYFGLKSQDFREFSEKFSKVNYSVGMLTYFPDYDSELVAEIKNSIMSLECHHGKVVLLQSNPLPELHLVAVTIDNFHGGFLAGEFLASKKCREYVCVDGSISKYRSDRFAGFQHAMNDNKCNFVAFHKSGIENDKEEIHRIISQINKMYDLRRELSLGLFFDSDTVAIQAIQFFQELGVTVGREVLVIGYDDLQSSSLFRPGLTTVRQPFADLGKCATQKLFRLLKGYPEKSCILQPELIIRDSAR